MATINAVVNNYPSGLAVSGGTCNINTAAVTQTTSIGNSTGVSALTLKSGSGKIIYNVGPTIDSSGRYTNTAAANPCFSAYIPSQDSNRTGNGATYRLGTNVAFTVIFDPSSNFNTNGTWTAPKTGKYKLNMAVRITACTVAIKLVPIITTNARVFDGVKGRAASAVDFGTSLSVITDMTAADTATFSVSVGGEAGNTDAISGTGTPYVTHVSGFLIC
jgi:hypothetical protein